MLRVLRSTTRTLPRSSQKFAYSSANTTNSPTLIVRARAPIELRSAWIEEITFPESRLSRKVEGPNKFSLEQSDSLGDVIQITVPRRCHEIRIESGDRIDLLGDDKYEVESSISLKAQNDVVLGCTVRANSISLVSEVSSIQMKTIEGIQVFLKAGKDITLKRMGAKQATFEAGGDLVAKAIYAEKALMTSRSGSVIIDSAHGHLDIKVQAGNLKIDSLSGLVIAEAKGSARVHLEQSSPDSIHSVIAEGRADITFAIDVLPISVEGNAEVKLVDPDVAYADGAIKLMRPATNEEGGGHFTVRGGKESTISILSWIDSVRMKAEARMKQQEECAT